MKAWRSGGGGSGGDRWVWNFGKMIYSGKQKNKEEHTFSMVDPAN
jgi:hypothetical protein